MKTATAKIKEVVRTKDHTNSYGTTIYHDLVMDNGDKIQIGKKKLQQVGWELSYQIVEEGHEYNKANGIKPEDVGGSSGSSSSSGSAKSASVQNMIVAQSCISSACALLQGSSKNNSEEVLKVAEEFYKFVMTKA